jgi:hypothetical protein
MHVMRDLPPGARPSYCPAAGPPVSAGACLSAITADVAARLGRVCADMPAETFAALVRRIALFNFRWGVRDGHLAPRDDLDALA